MARLKEQAIKREGDIYLFDPDLIEEMDGYNVRDMESQETQDHIRKMANAIHAGGTVGFPPITIGQKDGRIFVFAGHCRRRAFSLAKSEGAPVKGIIAIANTQNEEERTLDLLNSEDNLKLTPLEKAKAVQRLVSFRWTPAEIARRHGVSVQAIQNLITLIDAPAEIREMVQKGEVSATQAVKEIRKNGESAGDVLGEAVSKAKVSGRKKATQKDIGPVKRLVICQHCGGEVEV